MTGRGSVPHIIKGGRVGQIFQPVTWGGIEHVFELSAGHPPEDSLPVRSLNVIPFLRDGRAVALRVPAPSQEDASTSHRRTWMIGGEVSPGIPYVVLALSLTRSQASFKLQSFHPFGVWRCSAEGDKWLHVVGWGDGDMSSEVPNTVVVEDPDSIAARFRADGWPEFADLFRLAAEMRRELTDQQFYDDNRRLLEDAYLSQEDVHLQSGQGGGPEGWERGRRVLVEAIERSGTLLDIGCANGLLMETLTDWSAEAGIVIEPHGLDISPGLVELCHRRLPRWADRVWVGNVIDWVPPMKFDYVRTLLDCVPEPARPSLVRRLLDVAVLPGGRLIVSDYSSGPSTIAGAGGYHSLVNMLESWGHRVNGSAASYWTNGALMTEVAWIDRQ